MGPPLIKFIGIENVFSYTPGFIEDPEGEIFNELYNGMIGICEPYNVKMAGKDVPTPRIITFWADKPEEVVYTYSGATMMNHPFTKTPIVLKIKQAVEKYLGVEFNGCLGQIYRDGNDNIGWHADKEAIQPRKDKKTIDLTNVASLSFGATRKFRFRKINETKGWDYEFNLKNGDLLHMYAYEKKNCQEIYKHSVPKEKKIAEPRINLTFRMFP
jgi:alkylated DNA repair dioxygenase AlkB